jgi:NADPH-dependent 2,4-dienoyl-CoA reductase/sulfur reductase-like enzyme
MSRERRDCDVLVVGAGPAGLAAAYCAARAGLRASVVDDNPGAGGQIWRGEGREPKSKEAADWFEKIRRAKIRLVSGARVFQRLEEGALLAETSDGVRALSYRSLILATGARERFLPFPGWTLPNVMGAGGLQALVKTGLPIEGKRVVVAGSGPLLLAVAAYLRGRGAQVLLIAEQSSRRSLFGFGLGLLRRPAKVSQAVSLRRQLAGVRYVAGCWPARAEGEGKLSSVTMRKGRRTWRVACDYLACGFHLVPNLELAQLLGCETERGRVRVNEFQETSVPRVYCAGEATGIGGLELSLAEGQIAGHAAAGNLGEARKLFTLREKHRRFAEILDRAFVLRDELKLLPAPDTVVCRCEDVAFGRLRAYDSWRAAKLQTRCGMGPCQGRVCGAALEFLLGWQPGSVRPPAFPVRVESLAATASTAT